MDDMTKTSMDRSVARGVKDLTAADGPLYQLVEHIKVSNEQAQKNNELAQRQGPG